MRLDPKHPAIHLPALSLLPRSNSGH